MKRYLTDAFPPSIIEKESDVKLSIYMPTHRTAPDNKQDPLRFKNLLKEVEEKLKDSPHQKDILDQLEQLAYDLDFWIYNKDGLVILMSEKDVAIYRLHRKVEDFVYVGNYYYLKPLIMNYQSDHQYYALGLARDHFKLFKGNRYGFQEVDLSEHPTTLKEVVGDEVKGRTLNFGGYGGRDTLYHGHHARSEEEKEDTRKFFNYVDEFVMDHFTEKFKIPLVLVSLPEHQGSFRAISQNRRLLDKGIEKAYSSISENEFKQVIWQVLEPLYLEKTATLVKRYHEKPSTDVIQEIIVALQEQRVQSIVLELDRQIRGYVNMEKQKYSLDENGEDILNIIALEALKQNIEVVILPRDRMPTDRGIFALLRY